MTAWVATPPKTLFLGHVDQECTEERCRKVVLHRKCMRAHLIQMASAMTGLLETMDCEFTEKRKPLEELLAIQVATGPQAQSFFEE